MKCPFCSQEMVSGVVQSARQIYFTDRAHRFNFRSYASVESEVTLSSHNWTRPTCTAYHCPSCKKVLIDYEEIPE